MIITSVSAQDRQPPCFKGYVGKNIINLVNSSANEAIKQEVRNAISLNKAVDKIRLSEIQNRATLIIQKLESIMEPFHKDTGLVLELPEYGFRAEELLCVNLVNDKLKKQVRVCEFFNCNKDRDIFTIVRVQGILGDFIKKCLFTPFKKPLKVLEKFEYSLNFTTPISETIKYGEEVLFEKFANKKAMFPMLRAKKLDKLAKEFDLPANYVQKLKHENLQYEKNYGIAKEFLT